MRHCPLSLIAVLVALAAAPAAARADEPIATPSGDETAISADAGVTVFTQRQGGATGFFARTPPMVRALPVGPRIPRATRFDVGIAPDARSSIVWTTDCSLATRRCTVRIVHALGGSARVLTHIPYAGGGYPAIALDHYRIAYAVTTYRGPGPARQRCDVPYTRLIRAARPHRLDRGACSPIAQLDLEGPWLAVLAGPAYRSGDVGITEARVIAVRGGPARVLERESEGEESNFLSGIALDGGRAYTARAGVRQPNVFSRFDPRTGRRTDARAGVSLIGPWARDGGRQTYLQAGLPGELTCPASTGAACVLVAGSDPFAGPRLLIPQLTTALGPQPVFTDSSLVLRGTLTRTRVSRTGVLGRTGLGGVPVALRSGTAAPVTNRITLVPTGDVTTTAADGSWTFVLGPPHAPQAAYAAEAQLPGSIAAAGPEVFPAIYVHMTATSATRDADGVVHIAGTISPPQPGRTVRLDRRVRRVCGGSLLYVPPPTPSTLDVPPGCTDLYTTKPLATASVSSDGTSFQLTADGPAGDYRVSLVSSGPVSAYAGETARLPVG